MNKITIKTLRGLTPQDVDSVTSAGIVLEKQLEAELAFLQRVHKEVTHFCLSLLHLHFFFHLSFNAIVITAMTSYTQIPTSVVARVQNTINMAIISMV